MGAKTIKNAQGIQSKTVFWKQEVKSGSSVYQVWLASCKKIFFALKFPFEIIVPN